MKLEEFYEELKKLYAEHSGSLLKAMRVMYYSNSSLGIENILLGYPKYMWIKKISMAVVIDTALVDLMLRREKMSMPKYVVEALNNLTQEDFDKELKDIKDKIKEFLTSQ
jgi:hypothetical protein